MKHKFMNYSNRNFNNILNKSPIIKETFDTSFIDKDWFHEKWVDRFHFERDWYKKNWVHRHKFSQKR